MTEQFKEKNTSSSENNEKTEKETLLYTEMVKAIDEEDRIIEKMNKIFESVADREEAEKIILKKWAPLMSEAVKKSKEISTQWLCPSRTHSSCSTFERRHRRRPLLLPRAPA